MGVKSKAVSAKGTVLAIGDGATPTEAFTVIADVTSIKQSGHQFDEVDVTHMQSDAKEVQAGLEDNGEYALELNFTNDTSQTAYKGAAGTVKNFQLQFPTLTTPKKLAFAALVQPINISADPKSVLKASAKIRVSGASVESALP